MQLFRSGSAAGRVAIYLLVIAALCGLNSATAQQWKKQGKKKKAVPTPAASASPSAQDNAQVPLPVGHEAKGLAFPDIDADGHLRGRFTAGVARRMDENHMEFRDLNIITYSDDNQVDLQIAMSDSVLDINTHVLSSNQRTTIKRSDFEIAGDHARFDTAARHGTLTGNVKMVITDAAKYTKTESQ